MVLKSGGGCIEWYWCRLGSNVINELPVKKRGGQVAGPLELEENWLWICGGQHRPTAYTVKKLEFCIILYSLSSRLQDL